VAKKPTRKQKELIERWRLNPDNWLVTRNLLHLGELHVEHRHTGRERVIKDKAWKMARRENSIEGGWKGER